MTQSRAIDGSPIITATREAVAAGKRYIFHQGGTSSGKTFNVMIDLILRASEVPRRRITVVGQDLPNLKRGAIRDSHDALAIYPSLGYLLDRWNVSNSTFTFKNGSFIEFVSYATEQDAKSGKRDIAFFNEVNGIPEPIFEQVSFRTTEYIVSDFNPTAEFWVHFNYAHRNDSVIFRSTYKDNPHVSPNIVAEIESWDKDSLKYKVYGEGRCGAVEGLYFPNVKVIDPTDFPDGDSREGHGIDFGFSPDPCAIVRGAVLNGTDLYLHQLGYATGMRPPDIAAVLDGRKKFPSICDSAAPRDIEDLVRLSVRALPAIKGAGSIEYGLKKMTELNIYVTSTSKDLRFELSLYMRKRDPKTGLFLPEPKDRQSDHAIDAARYYTTWRITSPTQGKYISLS